MPSSHSRAATRLAAVLGAALALGGCSIERILNDLVDVCANSGATATGIAMDGVATVRIQQRTNLQALAYHNGGLILCAPDATWSSSDPGIATVVPSTGGYGSVTGIAVGSVFIRATINAKTDSMRVTVTP